MLTFLKALVALPFALLGIAFAVANRNSITISFDPFSAGEPAYTISEPLYLVVFVLLMAGVLVGGVAAWLGQSRHRKTVRRSQVEIDDLRAENDRLRTEMDIMARRAADTRTNLPALALPDLG